MEGLVKNITSGTPKQARDLPPRTARSRCYGSRPLDDIRRMASGVRDLKVWQEAVLLGGEVVKAMRQGTRREIKAFTDQVMTAATGVAAAIAEGYAHYTNAEQRAHFLQARRSLATLESQHAIARQAGLLSPAAHASLGSRLAIVSRLLTGYLGYLERQIAIEGEASQPLRPVAPLASLLGHIGSAGQLADRPAP